jgi:iron complex transport system ATP-binding protein
MDARTSTFTPLLEVHDLAFKRRHRRVLDGVTLTLAAGELVALLGVNGAGKSTLLRLVLGLLAPARGEILLSGRPLGEYTRRDVARRIAYVPQSHACLFPYTVEDVVVMGRLPRGGFFRSPSRADRDAARQALATVGIELLAERLYTETSGGERQLALIARALCQEARLLMLDEPATGLDYGHQLRLLDNLGRLAVAGYGILMTTHHPEHARLAATRVLLLDGGRVCAEGLPATILTPENLQTLYNIPSALLARARTNADFATTSQSG